MGKSVVVSIFGKYNIKHTHIYTHRMKETIFGNDTKIRGGNYF